MRYTMCCLCLSAQSALLESPSSHQHGATRFKPKPRAPGSSSGGSASSTPHSLACPGSSASTPQLQPHPPQSSRKAAKPPMAIAGAPGGGLHSSGAAAAALALECGSPIDSPRLLAAAPSGGGYDTPGSSGGVYVRRGRYSFSGATSSTGGPETGVVGWLGGTSSGNLSGSGNGRGSGLMRSTSGLAGADSSTPTSPVPNMPMRAPSSGGNSSYLMARLDGGPLTSMGSGSLGSLGEGPLMMPPAPSLVGSPSFNSRDSSSGVGVGMREGGSGGVAPLLGGRESFSGGGSSTAFGPAAMGSPRSASFSGGSETAAAIAAAAAAATAAATRPFSGKKTVCLLVDAVRSRDDAQLVSLLEHCIKGVHGLTDRHPITDRSAHQKPTPWVLASPACVPTWQHVLCDACSWGAQRHVNPWVAYSTAKRHSELTMCRCQIPCCAAVVWRC
jgi:hypothetical protein